MRHLIKVKLIVDNQIVRPGTPAELLKCLVMISVPRAFQKKEIENEFQYDLAELEKVDDRLGNSSCTTTIELFKIRDLLSEVYK